MSSSKIAADNEEDYMKGSPSKGRLQRRIEPEHFLLKVESFSESKKERYESEEFQAGGYKWRLILYPKGDKKRNGSNYISLYLSISDTKCLPQGWEVKAHFTLFVYNLCGNYITFQMGNASEVTRFNWLRTEKGFPQLLELDHFLDISNGYLFNDTCVFGAEVVVVTNCVASKRQSLSMKNENNNDIYRWKISDISELESEDSRSGMFKISELECELIMSCNDDHNIAMMWFYIHLEDHQLAEFAERKAYANCKFRIRNQTNNDHVERQGIVRLNTLNRCTGYIGSMPLGDLKDKSKGFVVNGSVIVEAEVTIEYK